MMRSLEPGSDTPAHTPEPDLAVVVGCMARIVVVGPDMTEHTTVLASGLSLLLPFPGSTPQMDEVTQPAAQTEQKEAEEVKVLCSAVDVVDYTNERRSTTFTLRIPRTAAARQRGLNAKQSISRLISLATAAFKALLSSSPTPPLSFSCWLREGRVMNLPVGP